MEAEPKPKRRRRRRIKPGERTRLITLISDESYRKLNLMSVVISADQNRDIRRGEILRLALKANFPEDIDGIVDQVNSLIDEFNLLDILPENRIIINDDLEAIRTIGEVAAKIGSATGTVIDAIALYIPDAKKENGEIVKIPAKKVREEGL